MFMVRYVAAEKLQVGEVLAAPNSGEVVTGVFYPVRGDMVEIITVCDDGRHNRMVIDSGNMVGVRDE